MGEEEEGWTTSSQEATAYFKSKMGFWLLKIKPGTKPALHINLPTDAHLQTLSLAP